MDIKSIEDLEAAATSLPLPTDILSTEDDSYEPSDIFQWANNIIQYKGDLQCSLFFFNRGGIVYRTSRAKDLDTQMEPLFVDEIIEYVLDGAETGMIVRPFEMAEAETDVLQFTRLKNVEKATEVMRWINTQEAEMEMFNDEEHDISRMKGMVARFSHPDMKEPFFVIKQLPGSHVMSGQKGWMLKNGKFVGFDAQAALRVPGDNQLMILGADMYVFSQPKLKSLFGYDAKEAYVAEQKIKEIEANFRLSLAEGLTINALLKGRKSTIKKLQKLNPNLMTQEQLLEHADNMEVDLMQDNSGAIIIMDEKDIVKFVNVLNEDYIESPVTGLKYEIKSKRPLKMPDDSKDE